MTSEIEDLKVIKTRVVARVVGFLEKQPEPLGHRAWKAAQVAFPGVPNDIVSDACSEIAMALRERERPALEQWLRETDAKASA